MIEKVCNLWLEHAEYRCIPMSGAVTPEGCAIMDSGLALDAAKRFAGVETDLGRLLASRGNHVHLVRPGLISFPIKQYQWAGPVLQIIQRSAHELVELVQGAKTLLPRPVASEGEPAWPAVAEVLSFLPDNIIVIQHT